MAKLLVGLGFVLSLTQCSLNLFNFYTENFHKISLILDDTEEKSESKDSQGSEKEDLIEKEKISQHYENSLKILLAEKQISYPNFHLNAHNVHLEQHTPPPKKS
ncbi:hypothetical protein [Aquimarina addita]